MVARAELERVGAVRGCARRGERARESEARAARCVGVWGPSLGEEGRARGERARLRGASSRVGVRVRPSEWRAGSKRGLGRASTVDSTLEAGEPAIDAFWPVLFWRAGVVLGGRFRAFFLCRSCAGSCSYANEFDPYVFKTFLA